MFAFAIYDEQHGNLYLARDPLGIKPLFYIRRKDGLAFASEIKALRTLLPDTSIAVEGLVASIMYYWIPESRSAFSGVEKLPPGHWAEIKPDGAFRVEQFWDPHAEFVEAKRPEPTADELRDTIEASVRAHLVSDVPVGMFLSGGIDSSLIAAITARQDPQIEGYTIVFRDQDRQFEAMPDDASYARRFAAQAGITLHEIEIAPNVVELLPQMVEILDEPIGDPAAINTLLLCQASREAGVKVMLSGMGADELCGGYRRHLASTMATTYRRLPRTLRRSVIEPALGALPVASARRGYRYARWAKRFGEFASLDEEAAYQRSYSLHGPDDLVDLLSPDLLPTVEDLLEEHRGIYWDGPEDDQVNRMCYTDSQLFLPGLNLAYTDRASMAASTEVRVPFVDKEVARAAFAIPGRRKIAGRTTKAALREAAQPWLPREIINRPKGLFSAPLRAWIRRDLREVVDDVLIDGPLIQSGMLNGDAVSGLVERDRRGIEDNSKQIWNLLTLQLWHDTATRPVSPPDPVPSQVES